MVFLAPGTEAAVLANLAGLLKPGGRLVAGFATDREYTAEGFGVDAETAGLRPEHRFSTWQLDPWRPDADWIVSVVRRDH